MSYLVFARKWRPLVFDDVVGQDHITQTLRKAIEKDRVAHAYLFTGTRGVGKTTTARIMARALNCDKGPTPDPCGECETCRNIIGGSSFDVMEIDGASNNSVDDIRELRDNVGYSSMGGKYRIFVIDEVHMLSKNAFNALLKTLEEPPPKVIFIFATTEPNKIPATIHSRCQRHDFRRITAEQIAGQLKKICTAEGIAFDMQGLILIARKADGSMRDALSLLDQVYSYSQESLSEAQVRTVLGVVDLDVYHTIMDAVNRRDAKPLLDVVQNILFNGYDLSDFLTGLEEYLRDLLFAGIPGVLQSRSHEMTAETAARYSVQSGLFSETTLLRMAEVVRKTENDLRWSSYPRFLIESMLLRLAQMEDTVPLQKLLEKVEAGLPMNPPITTAPAGTVVAVPEEKKKPVEPPRPIAIPPQTAPPAPVPMPVSKEGSALSTPGPAADETAFLADSGTTPVRDIHTDWPQFMKLLLDDRPHIGSFISHARLASTTGHSIDLRFPPSCKFHFNEVIKKPNRDIIEQKLDSFAGTHVDLHMTLETATTESTKADRELFRSVTGSAPTLEDDLQNEPIIQKVLDFFDGEVIS